MEKTPYEEGKGKYQSLHNYLSEEHEVYIGSDQDLEAIIYYAKRSGQVDENVGIRPERMETNEAEKAFYDQWQKENIPHPHIDKGNGLLQDLFIESNPNILSPISGGKWNLKINSRDRMIVATVIQWLGSNCGMSFLGEALARFGYKIVKK